VKQRTASFADQVAENTRLKQEEELKVCVFRVHLRTREREKRREEKRRERERRERRNVALSRPQASVVFGPAPALHMRTS
jgi:hypothetical protein